MALHPTTHILIGLSLIFASSAVSIFSLTVLAMSMTLTLIALGDGVAWRWVRRARLLLFIPPLINGYVMAGDGVFPSIDLWSPTWQGLAHGALQSLRLLVALLGLRLVMYPLSREQLTAGLTTLLSPLSYFGADIARLARRLTLTLAYLEHLDGKKAAELLRGASRFRLLHLHADEPQTAGAFRLGLLDGTLLALTLVILYLVVS